MFGYLLLLFAAAPIIELAILIKAGQYLGAFNTIGLVILTGILGAVFAKSQGLKVLYRIQSDINEGLMPTASLIDGAFILAGGILLVTPGFITDLLGLSFLIPITRNLFKRWVKNKFKEMLARGQIITFRYGRFKNES